MMPLTRKSGDSYFISRVIASNDFLGNFNLTLVRILALPLLSMEQKHTSSVVNRNKVPQSALFQITVVAVP